MARQVMNVSHVTELFGEVHCRKIDTTFLKTALFIYFILFISPQLETVKTICIT